MRKRVYGVAFLLALFLSGCALTEGIFGQEQNSNLEVYSLTGEQLPDVSVYFNAFSYDMIDGYKSNEYYYEDGEVEPLEIRTKHGTKNVVFLDSLGPIYDWASVPQGEHNMLVEQLGQYCNYNSYPDAECFVFYDWYKDLYRAHIFVLKEGTLLYREYPMKDNMDYTPYFTARDGDWYYVLMGMMPNDDYPDSDRFWAIAALNMESGDGDMRVIPTKGGFCVGFFAMDGQIHIGFEGLETPGENYVEIYNWENDQYEFHTICDSGEELDFLLRDESQICYGGVKNVGSESFLTYTVTDKQYQERYSGELVIPYEVEYGYTSQFQNNRLCVTLDKLVTEKNMRQAVMVVDVVQNKQLDFLKYHDYGHSMIFNRFMERTEDGRLVDMPYASICD